MLNLLATVAHMLCLCHLQPNLAIVDVCSMATHAWHLQQRHAGRHLNAQKVLTLPDGTAARHLES